MVSCFIFSVGWVWFLGCGGVLSLHYSVVCLVYVVVCSKTCGAQFNVRPFVGIIILVVS